MKYARAPQKKKGSGGAAREIIRKECRLFLCKTLPLSGSTNCNKLILRKIRISFLPPSSSSCSEKAYSLQLRINEFLENLRIKRPFSLSGSAFCPGPPETAAWEGVPGTQPVLPYSPSFTKGVLGSGKDSRILAVDGSFIRLPLTTGGPGRNSARHRLPLTGNNRRVSGGPGFRPSMMWGTAVGLKPADKKCVRTSEQEIARKHLGLLGKNADLGGEGVCRISTSLPCGSAASFFLMPLPAARLSGGGRSSLPQRASSTPRERCAYIGKSHGPETAAMGHHGPQAPRKHHRPVRAGRPADRRDRGAGRLPAGRGPVSGCRTLPTCTTNAGGRKRALDLIREPAGMRDFSGKSTKPCGRTFSLRYFSPTSIPEHKAAEDALETRDSVCATGEPERLVQCPEKPGVRTPLVGRGSGKDHR